MKSSFLLFVTLLTAIKVASASRILFLFPSPSKSHLIFVQGLSMVLAEKGHEVTVVSPFPLSKPMKNYRDIVTPLNEEAANFAIDMVKNQKESMIKQFPKIIRISRHLGEQALVNPELKKIMAEEKFDLVVIGHFFNNYLLGVAEHFKCPSIMLSVNSASHQINTIVGNPSGVSSVPHILFPVKGKMNFLQRTRTFLIYLAEIATAIYLDSLQRNIYDKYFPSGQYISYDDAVKNMSMVLLNTHFSQGTPRPYVPAMVEVGGLQIKPKPDPLPNALKEWLDEANDGAIFFSFGSNAKTTYLPHDKISHILNAFSKLKKRIVMKWDSDTFEGKPDNVFIGKWLPQDDILAHKNVQLFISHCGLGSTIESKYHGVPIVGIPLFADQEFNADVVVNEGWGVKIDFWTLTEKSLSDAINEALNDPIYTLNAKRNAELFKDRPLNARETAIYWVEYVIRHRGAPHLKSNVVHLNFFQSNSLDVIAFLISVVYVLVKLTILMFKFISSKLRGSWFSKNEKVMKKKQN